MYIQWPHLHYKSSTFGHLNIYGISDLGMLTSMICNASGLVEIQKRMIDAN